MMLRIDPEACVGHGRCYAIAPDVFDADDQGHGLIRVGAEPGADGGAEASGDGEGAHEIPGALAAAARTGAANCPENAILIDG